MSVNHTLLFYEPLNTKQYIRQFRAAYPYDIASELVDTLLSDQPYAHPSLLAMIDELRHAQTFLIVKDHRSHEDLSALYQTMCSLSQRNGAVLHTHQFQFDAILHYVYYPLFHPYAYLPFDKIACIDQIYIPKRGELTLRKHSHPSCIRVHDRLVLHQSSLNPQSYFGICVKIAASHGVIFVPRVECALLIALSSLYALCEPPVHPDFYLCYGIRAKQRETGITYDQGNDLTIGYSSKDPKDACSLSECSQLLQTMIAMINLRKHDLTLRGAMCELHIKNRTFGILICGDNTIADSALTDALLCLLEETGYTFVKVFETYGTLHLLDDALYANGAQIGAAIACESLSKQRILSLLSSSVLIREDMTPSQLLTPFTTYEETCAFHHVDMIWYLDDTHANAPRLINDIAHMYSLLTRLSPLSMLKENPFSAESEALYRSCLNTLLLNDIPFVHIGIKQMLTSAKNKWGTLAKTLLAMDERIKSPIV